ncbi:hypothetical protein V500_06036 [Pseudogymnoascus sp. VKM F-4518 (FW-2643)]|nr:hypothetical protein V500_06036 [Pseudogymnoascus sp. VKM F-4518 (FW-2643)]
MAVLARRYNPAATVADAACKSNPARRPLVCGGGRTLTEAAPRRVPSRPVSRVGSDLSWRTLELMKSRMPGFVVQAEHVVVPFVFGRGKGKCGRAREADLKRAGMAPRSLPWTTLVPTDCTGIGGGPEEQDPPRRPSRLACPIDFPLLPSLGEQRVSWGQGRGDN